MKLLFVVPYVPNLIRTRSYNLIRSLQQRGHEITLYTLWSDAREQADAERLAQTGIHVQAYPLPRWRSLGNSLAALPGGEPLQAAYCWQPLMAAALDALGDGDRRARFDAIHVEHLRGARYALRLKRKYPQTPLIWDSVDCISYLFAQAAGRSRSLFGRVVTRLELGRTQRYEAWLPRQFDHIVITSPIDRQALLDLAGESMTKPVSVLPNGVDWDYFTGGEAHTPERATLIFSGKMSYHANVTMALYLVEEIMPLVWQRNPEVRLNIVGKDPPANIQALASLPNVNVTGTVDDLRPYLKKATAAMVPLLYGAGSQFKALEAMACGAPVIATPGAISALETRPGEDVLIADTPQGFADHVTALVENTELRAQVGAAGKRYVERHHRWVAIAAQLESIYALEIEKNRRPE